MEEDKLKYKEILCNTMKSFINIYNNHRGMSKMKIKSNYV